MEQIENSCKRLGLSQNNVLKKILSLSAGRMVPLERVPVD